MMALVWAVIEWDKIGELLWVAPLAGLAVAITYSLMIVGFARPGVGYKLLAAASTAAFLATVVYGVAIIVNK